MAHLLSKVWKIALLGFVILIISLACLTLTPASPAGSPTSPAGTPVPGELSVSAEGDLAFGPGSFNLTNPGVGLADLVSYKATLRLSFDGTRDGKTQQWSKTYVMLRAQEPAARQVTIERAGDISDPGHVFMAEMAGAAYERIGENSCTATVIDPENSLGVWMEPAGFLNGVIGAEAGGNETVNGVAVDHYTFDERALGLQDITKSTGEIWVASEAGYIVKYVLTTVGNADYFGNGIEGTLTLDYELTDANQPVAFALPVDCPAGMVNAPQLPDASNIQNVPGLLTYSTSSSLADAAAFYQKQIPTLGWTLLGDPVINDTTALLDFTQGNQSMTVIITASDTGTKVLIELGSSQAPVPTSTP